jgi:exodeoxyribonuclease V alpha subunit
MRKLLAIVRERIPKRFRFDPVRDIQVLCPMNRGGLGARSISSFRERAEPAARIPHRTLWLDLLPGDKVTQVENDYDRDVYNGDLGVVSRIDLEDCELVADFAMAAKSPAALASSTRAESGGSDKQASQ